VRVLLVNDWAPPGGGTERYVGLLREGLREAGDEVRLLTSSVGSAADGTADYVAYGSARRSQQAFLQVFNPFAARTLRGALREFRPHGVHLHMFLSHLSPAVLGPLRDVPTLLSVGSPKPACPKDSKTLPDGSPCGDPAGIACWRHGCVGLPRLLRDTPRYELLREGLRNVNRIQTASRWLQAALATDGIRAQRVDLPVRAPEPGFTRTPHREPLFVYAGRLASEKGVDILLRAFAGLRRTFPRARLRVVGDGPELGRLQALGTELGLGQALSLIRGMSLIPEAGPSWFRELEGAWALVAPSTHREPFGLVAVEALVHGVPVIATNGGGFAETVEPGVSGLLVPRGDEAPLREAMEAVAGLRAFPDHTVPAQVVELARRRHDLDRHVRAVREVFAAPAREGRETRRRDPVLA
jgi:glycosyltransferase involved in cell wall biosynthesis